MSDFVFAPDHSFLARCWWQGSGTRIGANGWADAEKHLSAIWVETGSRGAHGHWDRYLRSEVDGELEKQLDPSDYVSPEQRYFELFWFGAYTKGAYAADKALHYEIRPADRVWSVVRWVLDYNSSALSGYVGIWEANERMAAGRPKGARLWALEGLPRDGLKKGARHADLALRTPGGERVRRYLSNASWFFNSISGEEGLVALEIQAIPFPLPPA